MIVLKFFLTIVVGAWLTTAARSQPVITEFLASAGEGSLRDDDGDLTDWIEIHHPGEAPLNLGGYGLTDSPSQVKFVFPEVILEPGGYLVVFASGKDRAESGAPLHTDFAMDRSGEYLALSDLDGELLTVFEPEYPGQRVGVTYGLAGSVGAPYAELPSPTPGAANAMPPPLIEGTDFFPKPANPEERLTVTATIRETAAPVREVRLKSRVMFRNEVVTVMVDDGVAPDVAAGDGIYTAQISNRTLFGVTFKPGHVVRWAVEVEDEGGNQTRYPTFADEACEEYTGTVLAQDPVDTHLDVFQWFVEDPRLAERELGTRSVCWFRGEVYDNVFTRIRGGTARSWPKKSFKFEFPEDHHLKFDPDLPRVDEFNLNATYTDKSYVRAILTTELHQQSGTPSPITFPLRVHQNGEFYSVALFVEQCDRDFLRRNGLDPDGAYYKANPGSTYNSSNSFEKKTRDHEGKEDLEAFLDGLRLEGGDLEKIIIDSVDIPAQTNFQAGIAITQNIDNSDKNHFLYRDSEGLGEFFMTPWDLDLTFGPDALNTDRILANEERRGAANPNAVHPFIGSRKFPLHVGKTNELLDAMFTTSRTRDMFLRRLRTLHDVYLATDHFEKRMDELVALFEKDTVEDREEWGIQSHFSGSQEGMAETVERIKTEYLIDRRDFFERGGLVDIPDSMPMEAPMEVAELEFAPASGNQAEEYIRLKNPNRFAMDLSGWRLEGAVEHTFRPGTVVPAGSLFAVGRNEFFVVKDVAAFRQRSEGPTGGEGLFVQGNYRGSLSSLGEEIRLMDPEGNVQMAHAYEGRPSAWQKQLVISEFLPAPDASGAEFIELTNRGESSLDLGGVRFTEGIDFVFSAGVSIEAGARVLLVRDLVAFERAYGAGLPVAGEFANGTRLDNNGERVKLEDPGNNTVFEFRYELEAPWPIVQAGHSYVWDLSRGAGDFAADAWASSVDPGGAPDAEDRFERTGEGPDDREPGMLTEIFGSERPLGTVETIEIDGQRQIQISYPLEQTEVSFEASLEESADLRVWTTRDEAPEPGLEGVLRFRVSEGVAPRFWRVRVRTEAAR